MNTHTNTSRNSKTDLRSLLFPLEDIFKAVEEEHKRTQVGEDPVQKAMASLGETTKDLVDVDENGNIYTTTLKIAEKYGKKHHNVIRGAEALLKNKGIQEDIENRDLRIEVSEYVVEGQFKKYKMYKLCRDAFSHIVMSYTGAKAVDYRREYMKAFNAMEEAINNPRTEISGPPIPPGLPNFNDPVVAARAWADVKDSELEARKSEQVARESEKRLRKRVKHLGEQVRRLKSKTGKADQGPLLLAPPSATNSYDDKYYFWYLAGAQHRLKALGRGTIKTIADEIGFAPSYVSQLLSSTSARRGNIETREMISNALGMSLEEAISIGKRLSEGREAEPQAETTGSVSTQGGIMGYLKSEVEYLRGRNRQLEGCLLGKAEIM